MQGEINNKNQYIKSFEDAIKSIDQGQFGTKSQNQSALEALALGNTTEAKKLLTVAAKKSELDAKESAKTYISLGALAYLDNTQEAIKAYQRATELDPDNPDALNMLGIILLNTGNYIEAEKYLKKLESLSEKNKENLYLAIAYINLGNTYKIQKKFNLAIEYQNKAIKTNKLLKNNHGLAQSYASLASIYLEPEIQNLTQAYEYIMLSINLSKNDAEAMSVNYQILSSYYSMVGDWSNAINSSLASLFINESLGRNIGIVENYHNLALFNLFYKKREEALRFTNKCLALAKKEGFQPSIGLCYKAQGAIYERKGELKKAKESFLLSLEIFKKINDYAEIKIVQDMLNTLQNPIQSIY